MCNVVGVGGNSVIYIFSCLPYACIIVTLSIIKKKKEKGTKYHVFVNSDLEQFLGNHTLEDIFAEKPAN